MWSSILLVFLFAFFFFSSRRRHTRSLCDWSSDVCSSDLGGRFAARLVPLPTPRSQGAEDVTFEVQLNVGLEARPLAKVASGGSEERRVGKEGRSGGEADH